MKKFKKVIIIVNILIVSLAVFLYLNDYYRGDTRVEKYLKSDEKVVVKKLEKGYFFDGPGTEYALVFYPGGKVEYTAYAPLMHKVASEGVDTFLIKMPFNLSFFGANRATDIMNNYEYTNWYIGGHSLGGVVASNYSITHSDKLEGLILLASYSTRKIDGVKLLSIYGSKDKVLNMKKYEENKVSEALNQLIETLYEYEIKGKEHKINIYLNIIDVYEQVLKNSFINEKNDLNNFNKVFVNDIFILSNININQNKDNKIINLINFINNSFKIDIKKNINDFKDFKIINNFFETDDYINQNIQFEFDISKYINNKQKKVEYLPIYSNKMHVHMLNKSKIDYSGRENNEISTCYIYDYRIEENYLSIRQEDSIKNENNIQNSNINTGGNNNMFGNITGKLFNLINDD